MAKQREPGNPPSRLPRPRRRYDSAARPIWQIFEEITKDLPERELSRLDSDAAAQHDFHIYGTRND